MTLRTSLRIRSRPRWATWCPTSTWRRCAALYADWLAATFRKSVSTGIDGWRDDDLAFVRPWGFDLAMIRRPVAVWQGDQDRMVPFAHGEWLAAHVPAARPHLLAGHGHLSLAFDAFDEIVEDLLTWPSDAVAGPIRLVSPGSGRRRAGATSRRIAAERAASAARAGAGKSGGRTECEIDAARYEFLPIGPAGPTA